MCFDENDYSNYLGAKEMRDIIKLELDVRKEIYETSKDSQDLIYREEQRSKYMEFLDRAIEKIGRNV